MESIIINQTAPQWIRESFKGLGTGGLLRLSDQLILLKIDDFTPADLKGLRGGTKVQIYRGQSVLLINLLMRSFSFELWWSPVIAKVNGEGPIDASWEDHPVFNIIAMDRKMNVRNIRSATFSPEVAMAISRGMAELLEKKVTDADIRMEMDGLITLHQGKFPEGMFHAICNLGD